MDTNDDDWLDKELKELWWVGALIYVTGSILINLGSNVIRKDHSIQELKTIKQPVYLRPIWLIGFGVFGFGNVLNFVAFMFAAQSLLAALGSVQFVTNIFFAGVINKEPITARAIIATCIIIIGNIFIVFFGSKTTENYSLSELKDLVFEPLFIGYIILIIILVSILQSIYWYFQYKIEQYEDPSLIPEIMIKYQPFAYATVSAIIGTNTIIFGKVCAGLVQTATQGEDIFTSIWTYIILACFGITMAFWLYRMNNALRMYDAMFIIPVLQCVWLLFGVLGGEIFFEEYKYMTTSEATLFSVGVVILLIGISILRPSSKTSNDETIPSKDTEIEMSEINDLEKGERNNDNDNNDLDVNIIIPEQTIKIPTPRIIMEDLKKD